VHASLLRPYDKAHASESRASKTARSPIGSIVSGMAATMERAALTAAYAVIAQAIAAIAVLVPLILPEV